MSPPRAGIALIVVLACVGGCAGGAKRPPPDPLLLTAHCRIRIETEAPLPDGMLEAVGEEAESAWTAMGERWGTAPAGPVSITLTSSRGRCRTDASGVVVMIGHLPRWDLTHEMAHVVTGRSWTPIDEGLATCWTEELRRPADPGAPPRFHLYALAALDAGKPCSLESGRSSLEMTYADYMASASFVRWLIDARGMDAFRKLYRGAVGDYVSVYGQSADTLIAEWKTWLQSPSAWRREARYLERVERLRSVPAPPASDSSGE